LGKILLTYINTWREGAKRWSQALSIGAQQQDKRQEVQAETQEVPPVCQETLFTVRVTEPWHRLPREAVESLSLEIFKSSMDMVLDSWLSVALVEQGAGSDNLQRSLTNSVSLRFCEYQQAANCQAMSSEI